MTGKDCKEPNVKIAALEDNPARIMVLERALQRGGHHLARFRCGPPLVDAIHAEPFDMLLLDRDVADADAEELLDWVRRTLGHGLPVMMFGASDAESDVARCLMAGADAYVPQPVRDGELLARIEALGRRAAAQPVRPATAPAGVLENGPDQLVCGEFRFAVAERQVWVKGMPVTLSPKEYALALLLFRNLGTLVMRRTMIDKVWRGADMEEQSRTIDSHLSRIRTKLALWPFNGVMLRTVYRLGSRLDVA
ncbi:DNA-binding response regulator, OmpR family, contains REC and winged-helix (wHTH) domain [Ralstonia sp. 25mfcol4.1]|uniref:response regulator transcription factor n=1 Tax=Burkholderiaceae TaxID=119060 RepID=UPI00088B94FD|nr:DNA-binding response regulator, OmpR family, contains REC and winged-helix (wHTH) domain [Ralstonia sp. 25mfcol4.1]